MVDFNSKDELRVATLLESFLPISRWGKVIAARRPFPTVEDLFEAARDAAHPFTRKEVDHALERLNPTIDELADTWARRPHARFDISIGSLTAAASRYQETFGRPALVRTIGRSGPEILANLEHRLGNTPAAETCAVAHELRQIGLLHIADRVHP